MSTLKCPKCGCQKFTVTAHVTETWIVDSYGEFIDVMRDTCDEEVTHRPSISEGDLFTCKKCGAEAVVVE